MKKSIFSTQFYHFGAKGFKKFFKIFCWLRHWNPKVFAWYFLLIFDFGRRQKINVFIAVLLFWRKTPPAIFQLLQWIHYVLATGNVFLTISSCWKIWVNAFWRKRLKRFFSNFLLFATLDVFWSRIFFQMNLD